GCTLAGGATSREYRTARAHGRPLRRDFVGPRSPRNLRDSNQGEGTRQPHKKCPPAICSAVYCACQFIRRRSMHVRPHRLFRAIVPALLLGALAGAAHAQTACPAGAPQLIIYHAGSLTAGFAQVEKLFTEQTGICVVDAAAGSVD